jgi:translocation and assembly module TamB
MFLHTLRRFAQLVLVGSLTLFALVLLLALGLETARGQAMLRSAIAQFTGIELAALRGSPLRQTQLNGLVLSDASGPWLRIDRVSWSWNASALIRRTLHVEQLEIAGATLLRRPETAGADPTLPAAQPAPSLPSLPLALRVDAWRVVGASISGGFTDAPTPTGMDAEASLVLDRSMQGSGRLALRLSGRGEARVAIDWSYGETLAAQLSIEESADGMVAHLAGKPGLGALQATARLSGVPRAAGLDARVSLGSGLQATISGRLDARGDGNDLRLVLAANPETLALLLADAARLDTAEMKLHLAGVLQNPSLAGTATLHGASAAGLRIGRLGVDLSSQPAQPARAFQVRAMAQDLALPTPLAPIAAASLAVHGALQADGSLALSSLALEAPALNAHATAQRSALGTVSGSARFSLADLGALLPGIGVSGAIDGQVVAEEDGRIGLEATLDGIEAPGPTALLLGARATLSASVALGSEPRIERLRLDGQAIGLAATAALGPEMALEATLDLPMLTALAPAVYGQAQVRVSARGPRSDPSLSLVVDAPCLGVAALPEGALRLTAVVAHPLTAAQAVIAGDGALAGMPLSVRAALLPLADGALDLPQAVMTWGDLRLSATGRLGSDRRPDMFIELAMPDIARLGALLGQSIAGGLLASARLQPGAAGVQAKVDAAATQLRLPGVAIGRMTLAATAEEALSPTPRLDAQLGFNDLAAGGIVTAGRLSARGTPENLALGLALDGALHRLRAQASLSTPATLRLAVLDAIWHGETVRLATPAVFTFGQGLGVDRLALVLARGGRVELAGQVHDRLALTLGVRRLPLALAALVAPGLALAGTLDADARVSGSTTAPEGQGRLTIRGAGMTDTPRADVDADVTLAGGQARLAATLRSGQTVRLTVSANAPVARPMAGTAVLAGTVGLQVLDPILAPAGRQARGSVRVDLRAADGALAGTIRLAQASFSDAGLGLKLDGIGGTITADGQMLRLAVTARAGEGSLAVNGTVAPFQPSFPVALRLNARAANLAVGTMVSARFGADLSLEGGLATGLAARGRVDLMRADIRLPERLPPNIVALPVRDLGVAASPAPPATTAFPPIALDIAIDAPRAVFVRGQGLVAELGGILNAAGTTADPRLSGTLDLRTGTLERLGQNFTFRRGRIGFDGGEGFNPTLDFEAQRRLADMTALIQVTGRPDQLSITLAADPEAPSDEVLARILFGRPQNGLTPVQLVRLGAAAAELAGLTTPGGGVLDKVRGRLGLDRLSADAAEGGGAQVQAGSYIADGVYIGARQRTNGTSQATIQLEVLPGVRLEADLGGQGRERVGASIGFEY